MRIANVDGRLVLLTGIGGGIDVERASGGRFSAEPQAVFARWADFRTWAARAPHGATEPIDDAALGAPAPRPVQVFGIGMNYRDHAREAGLPIPDRPATFTKFPTCLTGPYADVLLPPGAVDWEVELVVVMGVRAHRVTEAEAWDHVAGLTVGQDVSERMLQWGAGGQFSLGKSFPTFGPMGPCLVTPDELADPDDLAIRCSVAGTIMQQSRTSDMVFGVPRLIAELSAVVPLLPGDVVFTGTPAGIGATRNPPRLLAPGDVIESTIDGIGTMRNRCVAAI